MKIFGFGKQFSLTQRARKWDVAGALLCAAVIGFRMMFAEEDFSYDYSAYIYYFDLLGDYSFFDVLQHAGELFPYVVLPHAPIFEFGFVVIAKFLQSIVVNSTATYAVIAALSVGARSFVMRRLGCSWPWIVLSQLYTVTLLEANAIRVGMAVTVVLYGLYCIIAGRRRLGWALMCLALAVHLQAILFVLPFAAVWPLRRWLERSRGMLLAMLASMAAAIILVMSTGLLASHEKLADYTNNQSSSGGITTISVSALIFLLFALFLQPIRRNSGYDEDNRLVWIAACVAIAPSLVLYIAVTNIAAVGDRAWQFSFVVLAALVQINWITRNKKALAGTLLMCVALISTVNVTLRYPLSNMFDFILPHVEIEGQM